VARRSILNVSSKWAKAHCAVPARSNSVGFAALSPPYTLLFDRRSSTVMLALIAGIQVFAISRHPEDVDGRVKPGHDAAGHLIASGLVGEPTAPVMGMAGATNMNS
jgi:hypothetical protein